MKYKLFTDYTNNLNYSNILSEYPNPQFKRDSYINLNGIWKYSISKKDKIPAHFKDNILVPFPLESTLSLVGRTLKEDEYLYYYKKFELEETFIKDITIIHFEAVDQICEIYLNDFYIGKNEGGYLPFSFDITKFLKKGENKLVVKVRDLLSVSMPYGKQSKKRGGMWYTPISGIWGSVWLESVSNNYIEKIKITPDIDKEILKLEIYTAANATKIVVKDEEKIIYNELSNSKYVEIPINNPKLWTPETPFLYKLFLYTDNDEIESYFAMRKFSVNEKYFLLNNKPYFINGVLDQGYFSDGIYTPCNYQAYKDDVMKMKNLGFNTLRKHIKIEPKMFYYFCDKYGMLVIQDMVNVGKYDILKHTILPGLGVKKMFWKNVTDIEKENFIDHTKKTIEYLHNIPSIAYYTIFNEGWGQFDSDKMYKIVKSIDSSRVIDTASGWFKNKESDVDSLHIYFRKIKLKKSDKPIIVSEFGGYSFNMRGHSFNHKKTFGYRIYKSQNKFETDFYKLYQNDILKNIKNNLAGAIYTQLSDVEDETNGLLTYDRKICKINEKKTRNLMNNIFEEFNNVH